MTPSYKLHGVTVYGSYCEEVSELSEFTTTYRPEKEKPVVNITWFSTNLHSQLDYEKYIKDSSLLAQGKII